MQLRNRFLTVFLILCWVSLAGICFSNATDSGNFGNEHQQNAPCVFDNFVWFKEQEIIAEIRKDLPSFDGTVPESGDSVRKILGALERLLKSKKLPSEVGYTFSTGSEFQYRPEHVFTANNAKVNVCKITFAGAEGVMESELQVTAQSLMNRPFSKMGARTLAETSVLPVYRKYGYLRANSRMPVVELDPSCKNGVVVKMIIEPGIAYLWDKAAWTGNKVLPTQMLDSMLAMRSGEVANGLKIDAGLGAIIRAYGKQGYASLQMQPVPDFNNATKRISLSITVNEGDQFRMGNLNVVGLSEKSASMFKEIWRIRPGEVYDATYLGEFMKRLVEIGGIPADQVNRITTGVKPDKQKRTVDVVIDFNTKP